MNRLVVFYELGHGLLTAASLGIGACGRAGRVLGLHKKAFQRISDDFDERIKMEEQKRVWWGVICLDRYVKFPRYLIQRLSSS